MKDYRPALAGNPLGLAHCAHICVTTSLKPNMKNYRAGSPSQCHVRAHWAHDHAKGLTEAEHEGRGSLSQHQKGHWPKRQSQTIKLRGTAPTRAIGSDKKATGPKAHWATSEALSPRTQSWQQSGTARKQPTGLGMEGGKKLTCF